MTFRSRRITLTATHAVGFQLGLWFVVGVSAVVIVQNSLWRFDSDALLLALFVSALNLLTLLGPRDPRALRGDGSPKERASRQLQGLPARVQFESAGERRLRPIHPPSQGQLEAAMRGVREAPRIALPSEEATSMRHADSFCTPEQAAEIQRLGRDRYRILQAELEHRHPGQYVAINVTTGEYVAAADQLTLIDRYQERFGRQPGMVKMVGQ